MRMFAKYGLTQEYKYARRKGLSIKQALQEWDLYDYSPRTKPTLSSGTSGTLCVFIYPPFFFIFYSLFFLDGLAAGATL